MWKFKMKLIHGFLLLMLITNLMGERGSDIEPTAIDVARMRTIHLVQQLWKNVSNPHFTTMVRQETMESTAHLILALDSLASAIKEMNQPVLEEKLHFIYRWERVQAYSHGVHSLYETFMNFMRRQLESQQQASRRAWLDIAETILQDLPVSENIHKLILAARDSREKNCTIFEAAKMEHLSNICDNKQPTQNLLYNMYSIMQVTQLQSYIMGQSAYAVMQVFENGDNLERAKYMTERLEHKSKEQVKAVLHAMKGSSREMWRCDPTYFQEHETYEELTRLLQGYIENEVDMNPTQTCRGSCKNYEFTENYGCFKNKFCGQQPKCEGKIIDCHYIESDMTVCQSYPGEIRRYEYVKYKKSALVGTERIAHQHANCTLVTVNSWWRFFLPAHCSYCFCLCDEPGPLSDRFFSLSSEIADIANNKVITGLRFLKTNRVIYIQIQEGTLLPHGLINASSTQWKPVNTNSPDFKMSWDKRSIDLDSLESPKGHVLTGIRFQEVGTHLNMEIMVSPVNYEKGSLRRPTELSYWIGNENTDSALENPRSELKLSSLNVPQDSNGPCKPDSLHDSFLQFTHSDIITDAAQTTVPFLDIQPIILDPPSLLSGAGLYHKGSDSSAGMVGLKVINYDISHHLDGKD